MEEDASSKLTSLLDSLPNSVDKLTTIEEIGVVLSAVTPAALRTIVPNLSFNTVFECLALCSSESELKTCCGVLSKLLDAVDHTAVLSNFHSELLLGLDSQSETVHQLCLVQLLHAIESEAQSVSSYVDLIQKVIKLIGDKNLSTYKIAARVLKAVGNVHGSMQLLVMQQQVLECFESVLVKGDEARFRLYECLVEIAVSSADNLQCLVNCGLMSRLLTELDTDDVLTQLNCLELLTVLMSMSHGRQYLQQSGTLDRLEDKLVNTSSDPLSELLTPGLLKLFGSACRSDPHQVLTKFHRFANFLFSAVDADIDSSVIGVAVETVGFIGSTTHGKLALEQHATMKSVCKRLGGLLQSAPTTLRDKVIDTVTQLMMLQMAAEQSDLCALTQDWFSYLSNSADESLSIVLHIAQQPFSELRLPALRLINTLAALPWAEQLLISHPGFLEYLLDRSTERGDRAGLDAKYSIVTTLTKSSAAAASIPSELYHKLRLYVQEGPLYVNIESHVAFETGH